MPINRLPGFELRAQRLRRGTGLLPFELLVKLCRDFQKFAIARLPDLQKRPGIEPALNRSTPVETFLKRLAHEILFEALTAGIFQNRAEPKEFLPVKAVEGVLRIGHGRFRNIAGKREGGPAKFGSADLNCLEN